MIAPLLPQRQGMRLGLVILTLLLALVLVQHLLENSSARGISIAAASPSGAFISDPTALYIRTALEPVDVGVLTSAEAYEAAARQEISREFGIPGENVVLLRNNCPAPACGLLFTQHYNGIPIFGSRSGAWFKDGKVVELRSFPHFPVTVAVATSLGKEDVEKILQDANPLLKNYSVQKYSRVVLYDSRKGTTHLAAQVDYPIIGGKLSSGEKKLIEKDATFAITIPKNVPNAVRDNAPYTKPTFFVDLHTREILYALENLKSGSLQGRITGNVYRASPYEGSIEHPFEKIPVIADGTATSSAYDGLYSFAVSPGDVILRSQLRNERLEIINTIQEETAYETVIPVGADTIVHNWNWVNADESYAVSEDPLFSSAGFEEAHEESNVYYWINHIQNYFDRGVYPFNIVPEPFPMIAELQWETGCNAFASDDGLLFLGTPDDGECFASSLDPTVVLHEFTHRIVDFMYPVLPYIRMTGAMNEGFADYFAGSILNEHRHGFFYSGASGSSYRDLLNSRRYPDNYFAGSLDNGGTHLNANIFSGILWDIRQALGQESADDLIVRAMELNGARPAEEISFSSFCQDLIRTDDLVYGNDDFFDGSPHHAEICSSCANHGVEPSQCTPCTSGEVDDDGDGWGNSCDNCPDTINPLQEDRDGDGKGNACEVCAFTYAPADEGDQDSDGIPDSCDSCPGRFNPDQADADNDGWGDTCDSCPTLNNNNLPFFFVRVVWDDIPNPLSYPENQWRIAVDNDGYIYTLQRDSHRLLKMNPNELTTNILLWDVLWATPGLGSGPGQFAYPSALASDAWGNIYVSDTGNHRIQKFDRYDGAFLLEFSRGPDWNPSSLAIGPPPENNIYVLNQGNYQVDKFDQEGNFITSWIALPPLPGDSIDFAQQKDIAVDRHEQVYLTAEREGRVLKFDSNGNFLTQFGGHTSGYVGLPGELFSPVSLDVDSQGRVIVVDKALEADTHIITVYDTEGNFLLAFGRYGQLGGDFIEAQQVTFAPDGTIYILDKTRLQLFTLDVDPDHDRIYNVFSCDNCRFLPNRYQQDSDNDGIGDACQGVVNGACSDSDGMTPETPGVIFLDRLTRTDYCSAVSGELVEFTCSIDGSNVEATSFDCRNLDFPDEHYACSLGACWSIRNGLGCYNSDAWTRDERIHAGFAEFYSRTPLPEPALPLGDNYYRALDSCADSTTLLEYTCTDDNTVLSTRDVDCRTIDPGYTCRENAAGASCGS